MALVALVVLSAVIGSAGSAFAASPANSELNYSADNAPQKYIYEDSIGIAVHDTAKMSSPLQYYDDNGDIATLPATLNESIDNPIAFRADKLEDADLGAYPRKGENNNSASAIDASEWTSETNVSVTQTDGTTAEGVQSITVETDGTLGSSSVVNASYDNQSITSDPSKRVFTGILNVNSLESGTQVTIAPVDGDGDTKEIYVNASMDATADNVAANQTGNGLVVQQKLHTLATKGNGDGSFDGIQKVRVTVEGGDAGVTFTSIDVERKSGIVIADRLADTDSDDDLETTTVQEITSPGAQTYTSLSSLGDVFSDAKIHDLTVKGLKYRIADLKSEDVQVNFNTGAADAYGSYSNDFEQYGRLKVPAAIDLTHNGLRLVAEQQFVEERFTKFRFLEGAGTTSFSDISSWTDASSSLSDVGDKVVIDDTVQAGTNYAVHQVVLLQDGEASALKPSGGNGGSGGGQTSGNVNGGIIAGLFAAVLAFVKKFDL